MLKQNDNPETKLKKISQKQNSKKLSSAPGFSV